MKTFVLPPGYRVELVAAEPMIQEPVLVDFDPQGRIWVVEMIGYMQDMAATTEHQPLGRISVLEDTNADGRMDKKTVFLDQLVLPRALKVLSNGVLVAEPPNLWLAKDTNGDLRADTKDLVTNTYGRLEANVEHNANTLLWALDNWMHTSETDVYLRLKKGAFEVQKTLSRGQWGASQDDAGRIYRNSNESVLHVDLVPTPYFARNPNLLRTRGSYESLRGEKNEVNTVWPVRPTPGVNRGYQTGVLRPDGRLAAFTAVSAPTVYRGDDLPAELRGNVFVVDPAANVVSRILVDDDGTKIVARKAYERHRVPHLDRRALSPGATCRTHPTARSTSSTCIAASSSIATSSPSTCATRSCRGSSRRRSAMGASTGSCTRRRSLAGGHRRRRRRRPSSSLAFRTRMAGGETQRSGCWSNGETCQSCRR